MKGKYFLLVLASFLFVSVGFTQSDKAQIRDENLSRLIDIFSLEVTSKYDSLHIKDKKTGIISIEFYDIEDNYFPLFTYLSDTVGYLKSKGKYRFRISMIFNQIFFLNNNPTNFLIYKDRPILFFTGMENFFEDNFDKRGFVKKYQRHLNSTNYCIISWIVEIDNGNNNIRVLEKRIMF